MRSAYACLPASRSHETKKVLITARTYPTPSRRSIEVSCTAGITDQNEWIRLYPIPYRFLSVDRRFTKYQWIQVSAAKSSDHRPESYKVDLDSIRIISRPVGTEDGWRERRALLAPLQSRSLCELQANRPQIKASLGFFKPRSITGFEIVAEESPNWSEAELNILQQTHMFADRPIETLEKIPYKFYYRFTCDQPGCHGHRLSCIDWEMGEAWRKWQTKYGPEWEAKFREKFDREMSAENDTHFFVGTTKAHPATWMIVGLFYPRRSPSEPQASLLDLPRPPDNPALKAE